MSSGASLIEVQEMSRIFSRGGEEIRALDNISLVISSGEFVAITGASGSGKSTLMYILGLIDKQTSGNYYLNGTLTDALSDDERAQLRNEQLGFVFQGFHLLPRASALRNVAMPLVYARGYGARASRNEAETRAKEALITVGMGDRLQHLPKELSGGQRQRVAIARALINRPKVLFADEPTGNLDSKRGQEIVNLFHQLNDSGVTIVLVTHDPQLAEQAKRKIVMKDGNIVQDTGAAP